LTMGLNDYQVKLDQDELLETIGKALGGIDLIKSAGNALETENEK